MDLNPIKKAKTTNSSAPVLLRNVCELNSGNKFIAKLNHDCLAQVLMYLPTLERLEMAKVCQKWREAIEMSWYVVKKFDFGELMITLDKKEETLKMLMTRCGKHLTHLTIVKNHYQHPWMCHVLTNNCQSIVHFSIDMKDINGYKISDEDLVQIIKSMTKLKYLRVLMDFDSCSNLCNQILDTLPGDVEQVHSIVPSVPVSIKFEKDVSGLDKFNNLHGLTLNGFHLTNATIESILQNKNTLAHLDLSMCQFPPDALPIFLNLKNLEHLNLWWVINFNVNEIISIAHDCSKLKYFKFVHVLSDGLREEVLNYIFRELKYLNLEHLEVPNIDYSDEIENQISDIEHNWKNMKYLNLAEGYYYSKLDFQEITKFNNLEFLNLYWANIDSQSFTNITKKCRELREVLVYTETIPKGDFKKLANLKKLDKLDLKHCDNLTGNSLLKIANNCQNLTDLNLWSCRKVTVASLLELGKLKYLIKLVLDGITRVPNAMFINFYKLEYLSCNGCLNVTDEGIIKVLDNCQKLSHLSVWKTGITVETLNHAAKRRFVIKPLVIYADSFVTDNYYEQNISTSSPFLSINGL